VGKITQAADTTATAAFGGGGGDDDRRELRTRLNGMARPPLLNYSDRRRRPV